MLEQGGFEVAAIRIRSQHPETAVVVLSPYAQRRYVTELLDGGSAGIGYLLKQRISDVETFLADLRQVAAGGTALDPDVVSIMMKRARLAETKVAALTTRQQQVLALIAEGRSNAWIASRLTVTEKAIVRHTSRICDALGLTPDGDDHRRVLAVICYLSRKPRKMS